MYSPISIKKKNLIPDKILKKIYFQREIIKNILFDKDPRVLCIVGPCSIHCKESFYEYARLFQELQATVNDRLFLVLRAYYEKSRTILGWKGLVYDPFLDGSYDLQKGLELTREILTHMVSLGIPLACEILDPMTLPFFSDLIAWGSIGARTVTSQIHRQLSSSLPFSVGFKNSIEGNILSAVHGISAAQASHTYFTLGDHGTLQETTSQGNLFGHLVLRGSKGAPNYDKKSLLEAERLLIQQGIFPSVIIDCSHGNAQKNTLQQLQVLQELIPTLREKKLVKGIMLESFLHSSNQPLTPPLKKGISVTDPCLDWETTKNALSQLYQALSPSFC